MEYLATGKFKYTRTSFANGVSQDTIEAGNISEVIYGCASIEEAREVAARIFARYSGAFDCTVVESTPMPQRVRDVSPQVPTAATSSPERKRVVCQKCGERGLFGQVPFTTLPTSRLCDDCV